MVAKNFYNKNIYINEGISIQPFLKKAPKFGINNRINTFVQGVNKARQNVLNRAKSIINKTRRAVGLGLKTASLFPYASGKVLKGIHKGITTIDRYTSRLNQVSKRVQNTAAKIISHGSKYAFNNNSKIKKVYGAGAITTGKVIHGIGSAIKVPAGVTNALKNISGGTVNVIGHLYTKYGDTLFKIGNKIDTVKHDGVSDFIGISNLRQYLRKQRQKQIKLNNKT